METTTNQSVVDEDGDVVVGEEVQRWGWFSQQMTSGHEESKTNEEGR